MKKIFLSGLERVLVEVCPITLVMSQAPGPCVLVLCPVEEYERHTSCRIVPIWMGAAEASQLGMALEGHRTHRPMTHDLFLDALTNLDTQVDRVEIVRAEGRIFYSVMVLRTGDRAISLDARPSDAVALAIRQGAPIYMADEVLRRNSYPFLFKNEKDDEAELEEFHSFVESLNPEDFKE